ncbi:DUF5671 domain-containing protein [Roseovarius aestuariivivens]|uniref:DUF5671 domain-containing protein n=1 Tax=Roseovarius aestuariivivens TaxID=1888910 RepID=UPI00107FF048|nr:DUF5671 domain-containing protein [Roseovarius aestuariivivens]
MPIDSELSRHVREALLAGRAAPEIRADLTEAGWTAPEIDAALGGWMLREGAAPVPRPVRSSAAREAFFYGLLFVVFGMVAGNTLALLFGQANLWIPERGDVLLRGQMSGLRWPMAAVIVFVPVFWALDRADRRATRADASRRHGLMRRWLSAIAMLLAAITLLGDALYLIYSWLDGQITPRFLVKSAIVAIMAVLVLAYFREDRDLPLRWLSFPAGWALAALAVAALGLSFWTVGGPAQGQMEQRDRWRVADLTRLANDVTQCSAIDREALPEELDPMACAHNPARLTGYAGTVRYERLEPDRFRLCTEVEYPEGITAWNLDIDGTTVCTERQTN